MGLVTWVLWWDLGVRVLRVPFFYAPDFGKQLGKAIDECIQRPTHRFIMWCSDPLLRFAVLEHRGDTLEGWLDMLSKARAAAKVRHAP